MPLPPELVTQIVLQFPTVAILVWLLVRLDQRLNTLIRVICDLAQDSVNTQIADRVAQYLDDDIQGKF